MPVSALPASLVRPPRTWDHVRHDPLREGLRPHDPIEANDSSTTGAGSHQRSLRRDMTRKRAYANEQRLAGERRAGAESRRSRRHCGREEATGARQDGVSSPMTRTAVSGEPARSQTGPLARARTGLDSWEGAGRDTPRTVGDMETVPHGALARHVPSRSTLRLPRRPWSMEARQGHDGEAEAEEGRGSHSNTRRVRDSRKGRAPVARQDQWMA
jgi:hypothetical protein